jgi:hypothetical protein
MRDNDAWMVAMAGFYVDDAHGYLGLAALLFLLVYAPIRVLTQKH